MTAVLGVDGGQTTIRVRHSTDDRQVELEGAGRQDHDPVRAVAATVVDGWRRLGEPHVERVVLGLSTAPVEMEALDRLAQSVADALGVREVWVTDDAVTAHAGALGGRPGVSIVAGTGVACLAVRLDGTARIIGGHGFLLGDEGGGFWIGREGLRAALRAAEGRAGATALEAAAARRFGPLEGLHVRLHDLPRPVPAIATFAPDVVEAAQGGDAVAAGIVDDAADELLVLARAGVTWTGEDRGPVAFGGPLLVGDSPLRRRVEERRAGIDVVMPEGSPLDGALKLGMDGDPAPYRGLVHIWRGSAA